jgi:hypothetical protein
METAPLGPEREVQAAVAQGQGPAERGLAGRALVGRALVAGARGRARRLGHGGSRSCRRWQSRPYAHPVQRPPR